jgi:hypothetical protein
MQSIELDFQMIPINTISSKKEKKFLHVAKVLLELKTFESCGVINMEEANRHK